jgi:3-oxoacyl-[acyl-carrier-protein] synthase-3
MSEQTVYITDISAFLPNAPVGNDDMERILGQVGDRPSRARRAVLRSNGITLRHYAIDPVTLNPNYNNAQMTAEAVRGLNGKQISLNEIQCLSCGTSMADQLMPNHAAMVQGELQLPHCEAVATSGVCASSMAALKYAYMTVRCGLHSNAVATGSELSSAIMQAQNFHGETEPGTQELARQPELAFEKDFLRWMLSDGAGAMLLQDKPATEGLSLRINWLDIISYAGEMEPCMYAGAAKLPDGSLQGWQRFNNEQRSAQSVMTVKQDVKLLNENIVHYTVEKPLLELTAKYSLQTEDIDWFLPHYSSAFFRDKLSIGLENAGLNIPQERWFTNLSERGNTGAASIFLMLEELFHGGKIRSGDNILCYIPESGRFSTSFMYLTAR